MQNINRGMLADKKNQESLAKGLGWFSIGIGLAEFLVPRTLSKAIGIPPRTRLLRLLGLREITSGIGILSRPQTRFWLRARVAGDAMDLGLLGLAAFSRKTNKSRLASSIAAVAGVTALDVMAFNAFKRREGLRMMQHLRKSIIVNRPPEELYRIWHNFADLPRFMKHLISVEKTRENRWHWVGKGPAGTQVHWDAEVIDDRLNEFIAWRSLESSDVYHGGSVRFERAPGNRGTIVRVEMDYRAPLGRIGSAVAGMLGQSPKKQIAIDLLRFKQMAETGEIARTEGQPAGRSKSTSRKYDDLVRA